jgi:hypothetical protein
MWLKSVAAALASAGLVLAQQPSQTITLGNGKTAQTCVILDSTRNPDGSCSHTVRDVKTGEVFKIQTDAKDSTSQLTQQAPPAADAALPLVPVAAPTPPAAMPAPAAPSPAPAAADVSVPSSVIMVNENGRPSQKARILQAWKDEKGQKAYLAQIIDTREMLTIVETANGGSGGANGGPISTRFYHWQSENAPPPGAPLPPRPAVNKATVATVPSGDQRKNWLPPHNGASMSAGQPTAAASSQLPNLPAPTVPQPQGTATLLKLDRPTSSAPVPGAPARAVALSSQGDNAGGNIQPSQFTVPAQGSTGAAISLPPVSAGTGSRNNGQSAQAPSLPSVPAGPTNIAQAPPSQPSTALILPQATAPALPDMPSGPAVVAQSNPPALPPAVVPPPPSTTAPATQPVTIRPAPATEWVVDTTGKPVGSGVSQPAAPVIQNPPIVSKGPSCEGPCGCNADAQQPPLLPRPVRSTVTQKTTDTPQEPTRHVAPPVPVQDSQSSQDVKLASAQTTDSKGSGSDAEDKKPKKDKKQVAKNTDQQADQKSDGPQLPPVPDKGSGSTTKTASKGSGSGSGSGSTTKTASKGSGSGSGSTTKTASKGSGSGSTTKTADKGSGQDADKTNPLDNPLEFIAGSTEKKITKSIEPGKGSSDAVKTAKSNDTKPAGSGAVANSKFEVPGAPSGTPAATDVKAQPAPARTAEYIAVPPQPVKTAAAPATLPPVATTTGAAPKAPTAPAVYPQQGYMPAPMPPQGQPLPPNQQAALEVENAFTHAAPVPQQGGMPSNAFDGGQGSMPPGNPYAMGAQRPMGPMSYPPSYYPPMAAGAYPYMPRGVMPTPGYGGPMMAQPMMQAGYYQPMQPGMQMMYGPPPQPAPMPIPAGGAAGVAQVSSNQAAANFYDTGLPSSEGLTTAQTIRLLRDALYPSHREWAADQLAGVDWKANPIVVTALVQAAGEDPAAGVRASAVRSLAKMNANLVPVVNVLHTLRSDVDPRVQNEVDRALSKLEPNHTTDPAVQPAQATEPK